MTTTYESVLGLVETVSSAPSPMVRDVIWISEGRVIGVARDDQHRVEVFLVGPELNPVSSTVNDAIEFRSWHKNAAEAFYANRLLFPAVGHFDQVAAFICTELLRAGADQSLALAFAQTEPIIELAIERLRLTDQAILGLAGELLLLESLCRRVADEQVGQIITSWDGWKRSARDFHWGSTGVEVKTTTRSVSSHFVEGVHQVEPRDGSDGGEHEDRLFLVSIGLQPSIAGGNVFSIPLLVGRILARMEQAGIGTPLVGKFLSHVGEYGGGLGDGYDHTAQTLDPAYATPFLTTFFRAYDMTDSAVKALRRQDVIIRHHVEVSSVRFRLELPASVGLDNPIVGANQVARAITAPAAY